MDGAIPQHRTPNEVAPRMAMSEYTVRKLCRQGKMPGAVKIGGRWKIDPAKTLALSQTAGPPKA
jgi:DNA-binding transcriptional regulator LsrR (DeoR family)